MRADNANDLPLVENRLSQSTFHVIATDCEPKFYSYRVGWDDHKLYELVQAPGKQDCGLDQTDTNLITQSVRLGLNLLLFLSAAPLEYDATSYDRLPRLEGKHLKPGLVKACFVGQEAYRPRPSSKKPTETPPGSSDRHCAPHFAAGRWRRVVHGLGRKERRLKWISVYFAGGKQEHAMDESGAANETRTT